MTSTVAISSKRRSKRKSAGPVFGVASASANGANPVEVKVHATPTVADAQGDQLVLECSVDELNSLGQALRYVGAEVDMDVTTDIAALTYLRTEPRYASSTLLTTDVIA